MDKDGQSVKEKLDAFGGTWKQDQKTQKAKESEERKEWRETVN